MRARGLATVLGWAGERLIDWGRALDGTVREESDKEDKRWWEFGFSVEATEADAERLLDEVSNLLCGTDAPWCVRQHIGTMMDVTEELEA